MDSALAPICHARCSCRHADTPCVLQGVFGVLCCGRHTGMLWCRPAFMALVLQDLLMLLLLPWQCHTVFETPRMGIFLQLVGFPIGTNCDPTWGT